MTDAPKPKVVSNERARYNEICTVCKEPVGPVWLMRWDNGIEEYRCGWHGGSDK